MKRTVLLAGFMILFAVPSYAAKAAAVVVATQSGSPAEVQVVVNVSEDSNTISFSTTFTLNFTSSTNQINADIKQRVRDILVSHGILITTNDIFLFGGAQ